MLRWLVSLKDKLITTATILDALHQVWTPHEGQVPIGRAIFFEGKLFIFVNSGRKFGKSELIIYSLYRKALTQPNNTGYYIAPFQKQAKELIWANNRIQTFLPAELQNRFIESINNTEMRITFTNGSFIKLDGADNYEAYRGINPHFVAYDEFKDHNKQFHIGMEPNLATHKAPCLFIGTPPETEDNHFFVMAESVKTDPDGAYFCRPTHDNPFIDKQWLEKTRLRLIARGEEDVWLREYMAQFVFGGKNAIFPMYSDKFIMPYHEAVLYIRKNRKHWKLYCTADPATSSVFAVLFTAINTYTREVIHLDEIYEKTLSRMSSRPMWEAIKEKVLDINTDLTLWQFTRDEAAAWFMNEILDITKGEIFFAPTHKAMNDKDEGLSLIKDQMLAGLWKCTERTPKLQWEVKNYVRDDKGVIPKKNDHGIDNMRYCNASDNYTHVPENAPEVPLPDVCVKRGYKIDEDRNEDLASYMNFGLDYNDFYDGTFGYE